MMHLCGVGGVREEFVWGGDVADVSTGLASPTLLFGHIPYMTQTFEAISPYEMVLLCKSPVDHVLSLAKSMFDARAQRPDQVWMRNNLSVEDVIEHIVRGYEIEGVRIGSYSDMFSDFVCKWVPHAAFTLRMDQLVPLQPEVITRIANLAGVELPSDWEYRVSRGARQEISATYMPTFHSDKAEAYRDIAQRLLEEAAPSALDCYDGICPR